MDLEGVTNLSESTSPSTQPLVLQLLDLETGQNFEVPILIHAHQHRSLTAAGRHARRTCYLYSHMYIQHCLRLLWMLMRGPHQDLATWPSRREANSRERVLGGILGCLCFRSPHNERQVWQPPLELSARGRGVARLKKWLLLRPQACSANCNILTRSLNSTQRSLPGHNQTASSHPARALPPTSNVSYLLIPRPQTSACTRAPCKAYYKAQLQGVTARPTPTIPYKPLCHIPHHNPTLLKRCDSRAARAVSCPAYAHDRITATNSMP